MSNILSTLITLEEQEFLDMSMNATIERSRAEATPSIPSDLEAVRSKLVYLYLDTAGGATVDELQNDLGMRKLSLFPVLFDLTERDLVEKNGTEYRPI